MPRLAQPPQDFGQHLGLLRPRVLPEPFGANPEAREHRAMQLALARPDLAVLALIVQAEQSNFLLDLIDDPVFRDPGLLIQPALALVIASHAVGGDDFHGQVARPVDVAAVNTVQMGLEDEGDVRLRPVLAIQPKGRPQAVDLAQFTGLRKQADYHKEPAEQFVGIGVFRGGHVDYPVDEVGLLVLAHHRAEILIGIRAGLVSRLGRARCHAVPSLFLTEWLRTHDGSSAQRRGFPAAAASRTPRTRPAPPRSAAGTAPARTPPSRRPRRPPRPSPPTPRPAVWRAAAPGRCWPAPGPAAAGCSPC